MRLLPTILAVLTGAVTTYPQPTTFIEVDGVVLPEAAGWQLVEWDCPIPEDRDVTEANDEGAVTTRRVMLPTRVQFVFRLGQETCKLVFDTQLAGERAEGRFEVVRHAPGERHTTRGVGFTIHTTSWEGGEFRSIAVDWEGGRLRVNSVVP